MSFKTYELGGPEQTTIQIPEGPYAMVRIEWTANEDTTSTQIPVSVWEQLKKFITEQGGGAMEEQEGGRE